jgi:uncharacterized protein YbjT (DUF2867 family)
MREETQMGTTLVLGGTGKTGRRIVQRLQAKGVPVRVGTPSATPPFDWTDEATWPAALDGVRSVYVTYYPDVAIPGAAAAVGAFAELAVATGARRLVLLSGRGEDGALASEQALRASGADWTIVRSAFMDQNFNEGLFLESVQAGEVARASGRPIRYVPVSLEDYATLLTDNQVPADFVKMLTDVFAQVLDGHNAYLSDGVQRALGRPARDFTDFARDAAATGIWDGR